MYFIIEKRGYIITQTALILMPLPFSFTPDDWYQSGYLVDTAIVIRSYWPKMASDAVYIGLENGPRAVKYVLVSGFSAVTSFTSTLVLLSFMLRFPLDGPPPYYINRSNLVRIPILLIFFIYMFLFDRLMASWTVDQYS
jgi:hypothetical protein